MLTHEVDRQFSNDCETITYECFYCKEDFAQLKDLYKHIKVHSIPTPFKCSFCTVISRSERRWLQHKKTHTNLIHSCEYCDQSFESKPDLKVHIRVSHAAEQLKTYACNQCSESFPLKTLLNSHLELHDPTKQHLCPECGKIFRLPSLLKKHLLVHSTDKPFACTQCSNKFKTLGHLKSHSIVHSVERNYACDKCGKAFASSASLRTHKSKSKVQMK